MKGGKSENRMALPPREMSKIDLLAPFVLHLDISYANLKKPCIQIYLQGHRLTRDAMTEF
jgi:hypothetical protein